MLNPTFDASSSSGLKIPQNVEQAVAELRKALPTDYLQSMRLNRTADGHAYCSSARPEVDTDVIGWMVVAWNLRDTHGSLLIDTNTQPKGELYPDLVANAVFAKLCATH